MKSQQILALGGLLQRADALAEVVADFRIQVAELGLIQGDVKHRLQPTHPFEGRRGMEPQHSGGKGPTHRKAPRCKQHPPTSNSKFGYKKKTTLTKAPEKN